MPPFPHLYNEIYLSNLRIVRIQINNKCEALNIMLGTEYLVQMNYTIIIAVLGLLLLYPPGRLPQGSPFQGSFPRSQALPHISHHRQDGRSLSPESEPRDARSHPALGLPGGRNCRRQSPGRPAPYQLVVRLSWLLPAETWLPFLQVKMAQLLAA